MKLKLALITLLAALAAPASAAVVLQDSGTLLNTTVAQAAPLNYNNLTVTSGSNVVMTAHVCIANTQANIDPISASWDSGGSPQTMTLITEQGNTGINQTCALFGLVNPTVGNKTLTVNYSGSATSLMSAFTWSGASQVGGGTTFYNAAGNFGNATGNSTVTCNTIATNDEAVDTVAEDTLLSAPTQIQLILSNAGTVIDYGVSRANGAGSNITFQWTTNGHWVAACTGIKAVSGGGSIPKNIMMMGE